MNIISINMTVYDMTIGCDPLVEHKVTAIVKDSNGSIVMLELDNSYQIPVTNVLTF